MNFLVNNTQALKRKFLKIFTECPFSQPVNENLLKCLVNRYIIWDYKDDQETTQAKSATGSNLECVEIEDWIHKNQTNNNDNKNYRDEELGDNRPL